ncbi:peptide ligase PGM1-related protein [Leptolyngbya sp. FACHB-711]|uniref:peptide ligase PGM1-related protein n=1 Tax=unclassified Leptolyngbya TaxID=2650499 RepID=UPI001683E09C|nr:peptide ligase PGM1-related protein [Leptolyngbya sp. FACHB-711]MBD1849165.1 carboxylate-amine ligase [Cyanobacteria bacterium FACHB-502]MBD2026680.1 carboxylate-amine ligase [Leptolyngbya sp. FACHB-711]
MPLLPDHAQAQFFRQLQLQLRDRWQAIEHSEEGDCDILVIPSLSLDQQELHKIKGVYHYEERLLFSLIRLRHPRTRLIYVTSQPIHPSVIEYYLQLLPGIPFSHARERLVLLCTYDASPKPLTQKILERPRLLARLQGAIRRDRAYMTCFNSTNLERELSVKLGVPLLAVDPDLLYWGTKSGSREIFKEAEIPFPDGSDLVWSSEDLAAAAADLWERQSHLKRIVVKLNEGFSGGGNALLDLRPLENMAPGSASTRERTQAIADRLPKLSFQCETDWENYSRQIPELGAIVEAFVEGNEKRSPSVQGRITPHAEVEILSTHDQILGGPDGQVFLGCSFPADDAYRLQLQEYGMRVGEVLARKGALERYGLDFIAVHQPENVQQPWDLQAIEINLRKGGTTHPFMTLKLLTYGVYDEKTGLFFSQQGKPKYYIATDNLYSKQYHGLLPRDLMDIIAQHHLHFNSTTETGTVFHLIGCLSEFGKLGVTSIGNSPEEAQEIYDRVIDALDKETQCGDEG